MSGIEIAEKAFRITGRVQGVFFRAWTQTTAEELGLRGMVRNRTDGSVEAQVSGPSEDVREFEKRLWTGSPDSVVVGVEEIEASAAVPAGPFRVLSTI
jgi:acylphosphatase